MFWSPRQFRVWSALLILIGLCATAWFFPWGRSGDLEGDVRDARGQVAAARVRLQGHEYGVITDSQGRFRLAKPADRSTQVVAWKAGYRIAAGSSSQLPLSLLLTPLPERDNDDYSWIEPAPDPASSHNCGNCHSAIYKEWQASGHANSARNPRFLGLYDGGARPSWNLRREHPLGAGVCAACHAPTFSDSTLEYDLTRVNGVAAHGVHCDYCHKVVDAPTDKLGTRFGRDGLTLLRPANGDQLFFGPLDDAVRPGESFGYSPLYKESRYCASCHEGIIFGVHVYGTYSEWLKSPARAKGQQCQSCHMAPTGKLANIAPGKGGIARNPMSLASHGFPGSQADMLRRCLNVAIIVTHNAQGIRAVVEVRADDVGHYVPTGFIDRNLVLVVEAFDDNKKPLRLTHGPRLPASAGKHVAGLAGRLYAKELHAPQGEGPVPFWMPHGTMTDTRLVPGETDRQEFSFAAGVKELRVRLLYRRFWPEVAEARGWRDNESLVLEWMWAK